MSWSDEMLAKLEEVANLAENDAENAWIQLSRFRITEEDILFSIAAELRAARKRSRFERDVSRRQK